MIHQFPVGSNAVGSNVRARTTLGIALSLILHGLSLFICSHTAKADVNGPKFDPSTPVTRAPIVENVSNLKPVERGKAIRIKLEASTESPARMEFIINKDRLKHGTLTEPVIPNQEMKHIQTVDYTPFREGPDAMDTFTYKVKQGGSPLVSSIATVTIQVLAAVPELVANDVLEFGEIYVGSTAERLLIARNMGGAPFRQTLKIPPGFTATGLGENNVLELAPRATKQITLTFRPDTIGRVQQRISYPGNRGQTDQTLLYATGIAPLHAAPSQLQLEWIPEEAARVAQLTLTSSMERSINVGISAPQALGLPANIALGKRGGTTIDIRIPADQHNEAISGNIAFTFEDFELAIPVNSDSVPAYLVASGDAPDSHKLDFPEGAQSPPVTLAFTNKGTREGTLYTDIHHEFLLEGVTEGQVIPAGGQLKLTVTPAHNIDALGTLVLKCGIQRLEYSLSSEKGRTKSQVGEENAKIEIGESTALLAPKEGSSFQSFGTTTPRTGPQLAAELFAIKVEGSYRFDHSLPKVTATQFEDGGRDFLEFSWAPLTPGKYDYRVHIERVQFEEETDRPLKFWGLHPSEIISKEGRQHARIENLNPSMAYRVRIVGISPQGTASLSEPFRFVTAVPRQLRYLIGTWTVTLLCVASVILFIHRRIQKRKFYERYY